MKAFLISILIFSTLNAEIKEIVSFSLNPQKVYTIYCHAADSGVTTVVFPSEITGIYAARVDVKLNDKNPSPFLLSFTPGSSYFTIKSLSAEDISGAINVVHKGKVYVIHIKNVKNGQSSVSFTEKPKAETVGNLAVKSSNGSAEQLLSLLDKSKAYHLIKKYYPNQAEDIFYNAPNTVMEYSTHRIHLKEVIRFEHHDTIYFHILIKNKTSRELLFNPKDFAVNAGDKIFYAALTDASGKVPAEGEVPAWFCISGTKAGGRNNLDVKNDWKILLNVTEMPELSAIAKPKPVNVLGDKKVENKKVSPEEDVQKKPVLPILKDIILEEVKP